MLHETAHPLFLLLLLGLISQELGVDSLQILASERGRRCRHPEGQIGDPGRVDGSAASGRCRSTRAAGNRFRPFTGTTPTGRARGGAGRRTGLGTISGRRFGRRPAGSGGIIGEFKLFTGSFEGGLNREPVPVEGVGGGNVLPEDPRRPGLISSRGTGGRRCGRLVSTRGGGSHGRRRLIFGRGHPRRSQLRPTGAGRTGRQAGTGRRGVKLPAERGASVLVGADAAGRGRRWALKGGQHSIL